MQQITIITGSRGVGKTSVALSLRDHCTALPNPTQIYEVKNLLNVTVALEQEKGQKHELIFICFHGFYFDAGDLAILLKVPANDAALLHKITYINISKPLI